MTSEGTAHFCISSDMELRALGDQGVVAYLPTEEAAQDLAAAIRDASPAWLIDVVPAYASVGLFFHPEQATVDSVQRWLAGLTGNQSSPRQTGSIHTIPVCYHMGPDLDRVCEITGLTRDEVIAAHTGTLYTVYAIGFVPGFPYLGYLPERLCGVSRLLSPRVRVEAGSVGLTGRQTGIYPLPRPGGWNLIGRTPLTLVEMADGYFPLQVGDRIRLTAIDESEFRRLLGERLPRPAKRL